MVAPLMRDNIACDASADSEEDEKRFDICYWLDIGDVIVDISGGWKAFAEQNNAQALEARRVIGRNLLSFVHGDVTRMYVRTLIQSARLLRKPLLRPYRCDSPDQRRYMEMRLTLENSGLLRWEHRLKRSEPLARRLEFRAVNQPLRPHCVVRCSMCNRLKSSQDWAEPDVEEIPELADTGTIPVIYGVCPNCLTGLPKSR